MRRIEDVTLGWADRRRRRRWNIREGSLLDILSYLAIFAGFWVVVILAMLWAPR
jgi:hypothetical protein